MADPNEDTPTTTATKGPTEGAWDAVTPGPPPNAAPDEGDEKETPDATGASQPDTPPPKSDESDKEAPEPSDGAKPDDEPPAEDQTDTGEGFDKTIQPFLQEAANARKAQEAALAERDAAIARLTAELAQAKSGTASSETDAAKDDATIKALDEMADSSQIVGALKSLHGQIRALGTTTPDDPRVAKLEAQVAELSGSVHSRESRSALTDALSDMEKRHGLTQSVRGQVAKEVGDYFTNLGYTKDEPPSNTATVLAFENAYMRAAQAAANKKADNPPPSPDVKTDAGTGGKPPADGPKEQTYGEALQDVASTPWNYDEGDQSS